MDGTMKGREGQYAALLAQGRTLLERVDAFHFNSTVSRDTYCGYLGTEPRSAVIPVTHAAIRDRRVRRTFPSDRPLRLGFVGSAAPYKGLPMLLEQLEQLPPQWELTVYGLSSLPKPQAGVRAGGRFRASDLERVYGEMDLLVVPSLCRETFSLTALEALSFGTPVLVTDTVGARDLIARVDPTFVCPTPEALRKKLERLLEDRIPLAAFNEKWCSLPWEWDLAAHLDRMDRLYEEIVKAR